MMFSSWIFASPLAGTVMNFLCCSECMPAIFHGFPIVPLNKLGRTACPAFESCPALSFHQVGQSLVHHCPPGLDPMAGEEGWLCQSCLGVVQQFFWGGVRVPCLQVLIFWVQFFSVSELVELSGEGAVFHRFFFLLLPNGGFCQFACDFGEFWSDVAGCFLQVVVHCHAHEHFFILTDLLVDCQCVDRSVPCDRHDLFCSEVGSCQECCSCNSHTVICVHLG